MRALVTSERTGVTTSAGRLVRSDPMSASTVGRAAGLVKTSSTPETTWDSRAGMPLAGLVMMALAPAPTVADAATFPPPKRPPSGLFSSVPRIGRSVGRLRALPSRFETMGRTAGGRSLTMLPISDTSEGTARGSAMSWLGSTPMSAMREPSSGGGVGRTPWSSDRSLSRGRLRSGMTLGRMAGRSNS